MGQDVPRAFVGLAAPAWKLVRGHNPNQLSSAEHSCANGTRSTSWGGGVVMEASSSLNLELHCLYPRAGKWVRIAPWVSCS